MSFTPDAFHLTLLALLAAVAIVLPALWLRGGSRKRRERHNATTMTDAVLDYFRKNGVGVAVSCFSPAHNGRFIAFVESEPMKRFRLSHIIEATVREHVRKTCGLELEKIYWRFPLRDAGQNAARNQAGPEQAADDYINEGLDHYRHMPQPEVEEIGWEQFEEVITIDRNNLASLQASRTTQKSE